MLGLKCDFGDREGSLGAGKFFAGGNFELREVSVERAVTRRRRHALSGLGAPSPPAGAPTCHFRHPIGRRAGDELCDDSLQ